MSPPGPDVETWTWREVWQRRLQRHYLSAPATSQRMLDVVADVCGIHAQVAASAELSLCMRVNDLTRADVQHGLWHSRSLVKTYGLRGTLHVFPSHELALWLAALRARGPRRPPTPNELDALPPAQRDEMLQAIYDALADGPLTRDELGQEVGRRVGAWALEEVFPAFTGRWPRWHLALAPAALEGLIVFGPNRGNRVTYVRSDQWLRPQPPVDGQSALREVCRRYLSAYGPATHVEFARWFLMRPAAALELMRTLDLEEVDVEGWRAWLPAADAALPAKAFDGEVQLLPYYDCYIVGAHPRAQLIPASAPEPLQKGTAAPFQTLLVDGVVGGLWERRNRGSRLDLRVEPFTALSGRQMEQVQHQAERMGRILELAGGSVEVTIGRVSPRQHL